MKTTVLSRLETRHRVSTERKVVRFSIGGVDCAIDIMRVREIVTPKKCQRVFSDTAHFVGIANHRNQALPVVDLRKRLNVIPTGSSREKWMIVAAANRDMAMVVDNVFGVVAISSDNHLGKDAIASFDHLGITRNVLGTDDGLLLELDVDSVELNRLPDGMLTGERE